MPFDEIDGLDGIYTIGPDALKRLPDLKQQQSGLAGIWPLARISAIR